MSQTMNATTSKSVADVVPPESAKKPEEPTTKEEPVAEVKK